MLCLILFLALFATLSCSKEPPPTSSSPDNTPSSPDNPSSSSPDDPPSSSSPVSPSSPEVVIPDAALRTLIEKALKKSPGATITQAEMNTLESLDGRELGIKNLSGLETATNLRSLNFSHNRISDVMPLAHLSQLQVLSLDSNEISDIAPLGYCRLMIIECSETATNLQELYLNSNEISDIMLLAVFHDLQVLSLDFNQVSDLTPLTDLTQLQVLSLDSNEISDLTPLIALPHLENLFVNDNPLNAISTLLHIPVLMDRGILMHKGTFSLPSRDEFLSSFYMDRESPFNIDLVFLDDFTTEEREMWYRVVNRWESAIQTELPDYEFSNALVSECGDHSIRIAAGEQIDDLRIYITKFDKPPLEVPERARGYGGPRIVRRSSSMPVTGCIGIKRELPTRFDLWTVGLHEIGHVLGIGPWDRSGMLRGLNADAHFAGPQAIAAFDQAGGTDYQGAKVPTEQDGSHWHFSVLLSEIMSTSGVFLSAITLGALSDLGYSVDFSAADPYVLPPLTAAKPVADAALFCSLEGLPAPIYVDD